MTYRTDKFEIGDKVTWFDDEYADLADARSRFGDGPFSIIKIDDVNSHFNSVGHTQWPTIMTEHGPERFSGAFFKKSEFEINPVLYHDEFDEYMPFWIQYRDEDGVTNHFPIFATEFDSAIEEANRFGFDVTECVNV